MLKAIMTVLLLGAVASAQTTRPAELTAEPTRITMDVRDAGVERALQDIASACGIGMSIHERSDAKRLITLKYTNAPLLEVLADYMRQAQATPAMQEYSLTRGFYAYESLRYDLVNPTVLVITKLVMMEATAPVDPATKPRYEYVVQMIVVCDPALQIIGTARLAQVDEVAYPGSKFERRPDLPMPVEKIDCRNLSAFETEMRLTTAEPIARIDKLSMRLRAWQAVERAEVNFEAEQMMGGGKQESKGLTVNLMPPSPEGALILKLAGPVAKMYQGFPWQSGLIGMVRVDNSGILLEGVPASVRWKGEEAELVIGGNSDRDRDALEMLLQIGLSVPTKVRVIDIPIELRDLAMPNN